MMNNWLKNKTLGCKPRYRFIRNTLAICFFWIASQARNDDNPVAQTDLLTNPGFSRIALQATNDESCFTSLRACEAIQNLTGAPGLLRRLAMTGDQRHLHLFDFSSGSRNDGDYLSTFN